jgi:hypothetical protein
MVWNKVPPEVESTVIDSIGLKIENDEIRLISE